MAGKYWWEDDDEKEETQGNSDGYWWDDSKLANSAATNITNRVNTWLKNHNTYISNYQKRYSGRKGGYEDGYVSDSADWLNTVSKQKSNFDAEADSILSYLDQYKGYLDAKWVESVKKTLTDARGVQGQILTATTKDNEWWAKFTPNEDQLAEGYTADKIYQEWQEGQKQYANDLAFDVEAGALELEGLKKEKDAYLAELEEKRKQAQEDESFWDSLGRWLGTTPDTTLPLAGVSSSSGGKKTTKYDQQISAMEEQIERAKYVQGYEGYMDNMDAADYAANSQYVSTRTDVAMEDAMWGVGHSQYDTSKLFGDYMYDYINRNEDALGAALVNDTATNASFFGFDKGFLQTMSDDEIGVYNYIYKTQGSEAANQYLSFLETDLKGRARAQDQAYWANYAKERPVHSSVFSTLISPLKGLSYLGQAADMLDDGKMEQNAGYDRFSYIPSTIRSQVSTTIEKSGKWGKVGSFAYNTGMSMADFLFTTAVSGGNQALSLAIMGTGAAADATIAAKERGLEDGEAFALGTIAGLAEVAMEKISLGAWLDGDLSEGALKYVLKNALSEGGEEASTSIVNLLADVMIAGDKSEWNVAIQKYVAQGMTEEEAFGVVLAENAAQIGLDALGGILSGASIGGGSYGIVAGGNAIGNAIDKSSLNPVNKNAVNLYGQFTGDLINEGLQSDPNSESYKLAQKFQEQTEGKDGKGGKALSGYQIRNLVSANEAQFAVENYNEAVSSAEKRLTELGESNDVTELAKLVAKKATGQELTRKEKSTLVNSQYGSKVAKEMTTAVEQTYKPLEERVGTDSRFNVSDTGKTVVRESGTEIDIGSVEVATVGDGQVTFKMDDGTEVSAGDIDFADEDQSYMASAVSSIENITPAAATTIMHDLVDTSKPLGEQLNGIDEAYNYGFHGYSVQDLKVGNFSTNLTNTQMMSAYELGKSARKISDTATDAPRVRMRTEAQAKLTKKQKTEQQKARIESDDVEVYFQDGKSVVKFDEHTGKYDEKRTAAVNTAKFLSKLGIGSKYIFFESYVNETTKERVYKDANGNEVTAPNGMYTEDGTVWIDLNAGDSGQGTALFTMGHELTHFIKAQSSKQFKVLCDLVKEAFDKTDMSMNDRVLAKQKFLEGIRGKDVSYNEAYEEVVADAMSTMLTDGSFHEKIMEIKVKDKGLFNTIKRFFEKMIAKFRKAYAELTPDQQDARDIRAMKDMFDRIQTAFAEALVEASDNFNAITAVETENLTDAGIGFDAETKSVYSLRYSTAYKDTVQVGKKSFDTEKIAQIVAKGTGRSIEDARKWVKSEMTIANMVMANPEFLDFQADNRYEAIKKNSDYPQGTVDLSNLCPKREEFTAMFDRLQKAYPDKLFTAQDIADMRKILAKNDITVACGACFVEDRRQLVGEIAETFIGMWTEAVESGKPLQKTNAAGQKSDLLVTKALAKQYGLNAGSKIMAEDTYIPNQYDLTTYEGFKLLEKNHPTIAMAFNRYNNSRGQQSARLIEGRAEYNRQILGWSDAKVRSVNNNGGLRIFSFSDFEVVHLLDLVQVIIDCSARGVKIQGYTKIPAFAKLVRDTGIKLNRSLIPKGDYGFHMENGKVVLDYDTTEGIDINDENFIDESNNPNVGNIVIGINPTQIGAAMLDPFIDYIIPFHSNKAKAILEKLGTGKWVNYKESQHEKDISTGTASKKNINIYTEVINKYHPKNKVEFVEAFLKECKRQGKIPRYAEFLNVDENGDYAYREGYHKLLVDFKMFDADGNILPQGNITPNLNEGFMKDLLNAEVDKKQNYKFPQEVYDDINKKFGAKHSDRNGGVRDGIDTNQQVPYHKGKTVEQEAARNEGRKETREAFYRRAHEKVYTIRERGEIAFGYAPVTDQTGRAKRTEENLKKLGIQVIVHDGLEVNANGITRVIHGDSSTVAGDVVYVRNSMETDPMETAGHEAYHFWKRTDARLAYEEIVTDNIDFAAASFIEFQEKISKTYHGEEIGIDDDGTDKLVEEIFAYITGLIHAGDGTNIVRPFLRDYDAVKAAWDNVLKKQASSPRYSERSNAPTFYSQMGKVVEGMKQEKFGASSVISMLRGRGVKAEEIRWSGIHAFLDGKKSVTKQELLDFIKGSMLHIEEETTEETVQYTDEQRKQLQTLEDESEQLWEEMEKAWFVTFGTDMPFELYATDYATREIRRKIARDHLGETTGGKRIRELALAIDENDIKVRDIATEAKKNSNIARWAGYKLDGGENYREILFKMPGSDYSNSAMNAHWGSKRTGILAHARIQDFNTFIGKMLFIEEIQSDWHNAGAKQGYYSESDKVTVNNTEVRHENGWYNLYRDGKDLHQGVSETFLKQRFANGITEEEIHDGLVDEYNRAVEHSGHGWKAPDAPFKGNYHEYVLKRLLRMAAEEGYDSIGWTTADIQSDRWSDEFAEGYRIEYDQDIPKFLKKYGKQWDTTVGKTVLDNGTEVWSMAITDSMQKSVLTDGQAMYSERGDGTSNRDLLANAFEGITKSSDEYKLIQQYKGHIEELNALEEKLSNLNAEIRKIRFGTTGTRDTARLTRLENEAKEVAKEINKQDKRLLSLEASEPLRKVIERERKKEAQKTKDHVKDIIQNKKVRAEQAELRHKIRKAVRDLDKILNRGNKKLNVKEDVQGVVSKALKAADILFTENYGNYDMLRNGIDTDLSDAEEALVATCTRMLKDLDKMPTDGYENWQARQEAENRLKTKMSKLKDVFARERKRLNNTTVSSILGELADSYKSLESSEQSYVSGAYMEPVYEFLKNLQKEVGGTVVSDMTKDQLESVYAAYKMVLTTVRKANALFNEGLKMSREELGNAVIEEVMRAGGVHGLWTKAEIAKSQFDWNNMKPVWVANRIGSEAFANLMQGLFEGQYNFAKDIEEAKNFKQEMDKKYKPRNWDAEKQYKFESSTGKEFSLNLQQIMSLYAFSKREQAYSHLLNGGFVFEGNSTVIVDEKGRKKTYIHNGATSYKLNEATLNRIINSLTAEQKAYVDDMQKYLSEVMGAKGNEVSMQLYGIKMFKEQFYFPLRSSGAYMERAKEAELKKQQGQINLVNSGFTHSVKPEAKNPIILAGFMDVWAEHCNEMSMYHSMVLPMEDFRKVYNYSTIHDDKFDSASVYQTIQDAYGKAATDYIDQLYRELNAGATVDPRETPWKARISKFKKASVLMSTSVWVQQFSSIGRAYAVIDPKYFTGAKVNSDTKLSVVEEMKKYAPVAIIKEMGGFDTGTKGSAKSYIMAEQYGNGERRIDRIKDRAEGFLKDEQYRGDIMGYLPAKADEKTWCAIWEAAKRETRAKHPKMDVKSEEFLKLAGERFSEVIEKTQVYDSVLARSANMRSKSGLMQMATAFMAEPTTTINLLEDAIRSGNKKHMARAFGAVGVSIVLNNALASIVYAMRDDDEDETFMEKYFQSFTSGMIDDINPMSYYPFLKDVYSLFQGYDVERADMSVIADVRDALKKAISVIGKDTSEMDDEKLVEHWKTVAGSLMSLLDAGCAYFGAPIKNVRRDAMGLINAFSTIGKDLTERDNSWASFWDKVGAAAKDTIPIYAWTKDKAKADKLYHAIVSGDKAYLDRLKSTYKTDSAYESAVRKALRENDHRIHAAAQARYEGKAEEYKRIFREIQNEGKFSFDDIMSAINSEENAIRNGIEPDKVTSEYTASGFVEAMILGDTGNAKAMKDDIIATYIANGKTEKEAEEEFASAVSTGIKNAYSAGLLDDTGAENMLIEYAGKDEEEAASKVSYWAFCEEYPEYKDVFSEANVAKYHEFGEPAEIPVDVYAQFITGTKGIKTIRDEWGDIVLSEREQVLDVIDSLPLTWQQKDALYLAYDYAESKIWDVPW